MVAAGVRDGTSASPAGAAAVPLLIGLAVWAAGLDSAAEGYRTFLLRWDTAELINPTTIRNAFTQAFFSITRGSAASWPMPPISIAGLTAP